ncbi:MAG: hypothetical protein R3B90_22790 [Planctomycetaceae bacterium]
MARRTSNEGEAISLFPFLSILACLIGTLTLMIVAVVIGQMGREQSTETVDRSAAFDKASADVAAQEAELENLQRLIAEAQALEQQLRLANEEIASLENDQDKLVGREDANSEYARMLAEANTLRKRLTEIEGEPVLLAKEIEELEAQIKKREAGPEEAVVQIRPGGSGVDIDPVFVECTANDVVLLHEDEAKQVRIRTGDLNKEGGDFHQLLARVAKMPKGQIIFLVRPDGVNTYNSARNVARSHYTADGYAKNGKLPVPSQGNIDLSVFKR